MTMTNKAHDLPGVVEVAGDIMLRCNEAPECPFCGIGGEGCVDDEHDPDELCGRLDAALGGPRTVQAVGASRAADATERELARMTAVTIEQGALLSVFRRNADRTTEQREVNAARAMLAAAAGRLRARAGSDADASDVLAYAMRCAASEIETMSDDAVVLGVLREDADDRAAARARLIATGHRVPGWMR